LNGEGIWRIIDARRREAEERAAALAVEVERRRRVLEERGEG